MEGETDSLSKSENRLSSFFSVWDGFFDRLDSLCRTDSGFGTSLRRLSNHSEARDFTVDSLFSRDGDSFLFIFSGFQPVSYFSQMDKKIPEYFGKDFGNSFDPGWGHDLDEFIRVAFWNDDTVADAPVEEAKLIVSWLWTTLEGRMRLRQISLVLIFCCLAAFYGCGDKKIASQTNKTVTSASLLAPEDLGPALAFTLPTTDGVEISFSDFQGKTVLIDFWATWCPPCREEIPEFVDLYHRYKGRGVEIIGISLDKGNAEGVKKFVEEFGIQYPVVIADEEVVHTFGGVRAIPTTFLVNSKGRIVKKYIGLHPGKEFEQDIIHSLGQNE